MSALAKTEMLERKNLPVELLLPNPNNPNRMGDKEFNLLVDNMKQVGFVDPAFVRPHPTKAGHYQIIGGHHRIEAAKFLGFKEVPVTVTNDPDMTEELEEFQLVRMNVIHGNIQPTLFLDLYHKYKDKYGEAVLQDMFGFADEAAFKKLIADTKKNLPKEMQAKFVEAAKEVKTIDGLAKILNRLFTQYGSTLDYGYMVVDYGGKDSIWLRVTNKTHKNLLKLGDFCVQNHRTVDAVMGGILQLIAQGKLDQQLAEIVQNTVPVTINGVAFPTAEALNVVDTASAE